MTDYNWLPYSPSQDVRDPWDVLIDQMFEQTQPRRAPLIAPPKVTVRSRGVKTEQDILAYIQAHPGTGRQAICRDLDLIATTVSAAITRLESERLVTRAGVGTQNRCYYPVKFELEDACDALILALQAYRANNQAYEAARIERWGLDHPKATETVSEEVVHDDHA